MTSLTVIKEDFETYGITLGEQLLHRCLELCHEHNVSGEDIAACWIGYSLSKGCEEINLDYLEQFARDELGKKKRNKVSDVNNGFVVHDASTIDMVNAGDHDLLAAYGGGTTASPASANKIVKQANTPDTSVAKRLLGTPASSKRTNLCLTPEVSTPSGKYSSRTNAGTVVVSHGSVNSKFRANHSYEPKVSWLCGEGGDDVLREPYMYMFEKVRDNAEVLEDTINVLADQMKQHLQLEDWTSLKATSNETIFTVGRICCDSVGRLNAASVLLEGCREVSGGSTVALDLSRLPQYSLFPGQVVAVKGVHATGNKMLVQSVLQGKVLPLPDSAINISSGGLQMVVACGPFTSSDNLLYQPLLDLMTLLSDNPPHILVLLGPLVDASHPHIIDGSLAQSHDNLHAHVLNIVTSALKPTVTQLVIVSSNKDVTCSLVYPTPPPSIMDSSALWLSDPAFLDIDGVVVALTSTDIVFHLGREEISFPPQSSDRLGRLTRHLLAQQNLYPLYPPPERMSVSQENAEVHSKLTCTPHVLIVPSDLRHFIKDLEGCIAVNPERLTKGTAGGTFLRMELMPPANTRGSMAKSINAQVIKI